MELKFGALRAGFGRGEACLAPCCLCRLTRQPKSKSLPHCQKNVFGIAGSLPNHAGYIAALIDQFLLRRLDLALCVIAQLQPGDDFVAAPAIRTEWE